MDYLLHHENKCQSPAVIVNAGDVFSLVEAFMLDGRYPNHRWREFHLTYVNEYRGHQSYGMLQPMFEAPFEALEYLSIRNERITNERDETPPTIVMELEDSDLLCAWRMPKLTHLKLHNVYPLNPLQCDNVTHFTFEVYWSEEEGLDMGIFRQLLQSMPKIQSLYFASNASVVFADSALTRLALPCLEFFELKIGVATPALTISQFMAIVNVQDIKRLSLKFHGSFLCDEKIFVDWIFALTPFTDGDGEPKPQSPFLKLEDITMEVQDLQGSAAPFARLLYTMPNVKNISMRLSEPGNLVFVHAWKEWGMLQYLRTLRLAFPQSSPDDFLMHLSLLETFFGDGYCKDFERLEVQFREHINSEMREAQMFNILGEKLRWVEC
ncbi:hypothetical protein SCHPADRAFT_932560 [Schizopora paradoxa]|uniref:F-box domain-containing protein n=1 Tax=Schizopora paradoxa TaxID=27342 RepID=A0A0H2R645_9AGAM|nr:hypothetical protein SCHPADRAFT_932560 [Schizopora paradoxa]